ncbi:hypothetical protein Goari_006273 [Gossypium aridum]|uniref:Uncharacterized protein n=1 Tax=Gossypium aridum TaxID=34290 RepID=A0A7J8XP27_GOSAI|nr:hypothetical protein [Gossypium aridum]
MGVEIGWEESSCICRASVGSEMGKGPGLRQEIGLLSELWNRRGKGNDYLLGRVKGMDLIGYYGR